jgi:hypothetical protein
MFQNGTEEGCASAQEAERRGTSRHEHVERITLSTQWGTSAASLMDISETGAQVRIANGIMPFQGDDIMLRLVDGRHLTGSIAWSERDALGIRFEQALPALDDLLWLEQRGPEWFRANLRAQRQ